MPRLSNEGSFTISVGTIVKIVLTLSVLALLFYLRDLILIIITAVVLASAIEPLVEWMVSRGIARTLAVLLIYICVAVVVIGLLYLFLPALISDLRGISSTLPEQLANLSEYAQNTIPFTSVTLDLAGNLTLKDLITLIEAQVSSPAGSALQTVGVLFGGIFSCVLIIVLSFYLAVQDDGVEDVLRVITPVQHERYAIDLWKRSRRKIGLWMQGQIFLGLFMAIFVFLGLSLLGIKYAIALALLAGIFELIPYFGPVLSAAPAVLLGFMQDPVTGLLALGFYVIMQQFENHLLYPLVVKKIVGVPALLVIIAMIVGGKLAGFLGLLIAVPIAAVLMELLSDWEKRKLVFAAKETE